MSYSSSDAAASSGQAIGQQADARPSIRERLGAVAVRVPKPELLAVMGLAALLNLWALSRNGWANEYYAAAVRSMSSSWHDFLFASLDKGGVMTVDKPPLALWVEALSARVFGFNSLSLLVPQALMGVASVALVYDLVRRRFGRLGGFVAGLVLALTPVTVAISRHNNPDALLVLCCVAAVWCAVRATEHGSTRWLLACGVCVGLGFETKMGVALTVVPAIVAAWLWIDPAGRGRLRATGQLLVGGAAMLIVGGAWPLLVELTPAADRPWISGTPNNTVFSLIFEYNGLGRVEGQAGGPGGIAGTMFGGAAGPLRLLNDALGGQVGWLLGFGVVAAIGILAACRLHRRDARSGWLILVGGMFLTSAVLFSFAGGIFHPYYVSLLAPFLAALVGAGTAQLLDGSLRSRIVAPAAVIAGVIVELLVKGEYASEMGWLTPVLIAAAILAPISLVMFGGARARIAALGCALAVLLLAPAAWALDTLGHATSGTFPTGGPATQSQGGPGGGGPGGGFGGGRGGGFAGAGGVPGAAGTAQPLFGGAQQGAAGSQAAPGGREGPPAARAGGGEAGAPVNPGGPRSPGNGAGGSVPGIAAIGGQGGAGAGQFGGGVSSTVEKYVNAHGGGTIAVSSQSSAASSILHGDGNVAGIGGFSGRESDVTVSWLAQQVAAGKISWVLDEESASVSATSTGLGRQGSGPGAGGGLPGDSRTGARTAMKAVAKECVKVDLAISGQSGSSGSLYDCVGRAVELASLAAAQ